MSQPDLRNRADGSGPSRGRIPVAQRRRDATRGRAARRDSVRSLARAAPRSRRVGRAVRRAGVGRAGGQRPSYCGCPWRAGAERRERPLADDFYRRGRARARGALADVGRGARLLRGAPDADGQRRGSPVGSRSTRTASGRWKRSGESVSKASKACCIRWPSRSTSARFSATCRTSSGAGSPTTFWR